MSPSQKHVPAHAPGGRPRILYIEDNTTLAETIAGVFDKLGYNITLASTGEEGLRKYKGDETVVITDRDLGSGMNGDAVIRNIRDKKPGQPMIMFTDLNELPEDARIEGVTYVDKGGIMELVTAVRETPGGEEDLSMTIGFLAVEPAKPVSAVALEVFPEREPPPWLDMLANRAVWKLFRTVDQIRRDRV